MRALLDRIGRQGRNGAGVLRTILDERDPLHAPTESDKETELLAVHAQARTSAAGPAVRDLPQPLASSRVVDFAYVEATGSRSSTKATSTTPASWRSSATAPAETSCSSSAGYPSARPKPTCEREATGSATRSVKHSSDGADRFWRRCGHLCGVRSDAKTQWGAESGEELGDERRGGRRGRRASTGRRRTRRRARRPPPPRARSRQPLRDRDRRRRRAEARSALTRRGASSSTSPCRTAADVRLRACRGRARGRR